MKVVVPVEMTDAQLITSNIPENDHPEYDPAATYNTGDRVIVTSTGVHNIYEVVSETSITGVDPVTDDGTNWLEIGKTNRWRMFDQIIGTTTSGKQTFDPWTYEILDGATYEANFETEQYYVLEDGQGIAKTIRPDVLADAIAVFNVSALYADVRIETTEGYVYETRIPLGGEISNSNWYNYFFQPIERIDQFILTDLPQTAEKDIHISFVEGDTADPSVGEMVTGRQNIIGKSMYGTNLGIIDFSRKERDVFGNFQIIERGFADTMEVDLSIANEDVTFVKRFLRELRAKPAVYIAGECIDATVLYGYYTDFEIVISGPSRSDGSITIEGLI